MSRPRIKPSEVAQAQRLTRERAEDLAGSEVQGGDAEAVGRLIKLDEAQIGKLAAAHAFPLTDYLERLRIDTQREFESALAAVRDGAEIRIESGSAFDTLERLDHNLDDLRSPDEGSGE